MVSLRWLRPQAIERVQRSSADILEQDRTMQRNMCQLLRQYLTNFIRPECLTGVSEHDIDRFDFWDAEMEVPTLSWVSVQQLACCSRKRQTAWKERNKRLPSSPLLAMSSDPDSPSQSSTSDNTSDMVCTSTCAAFFTTVRAFYHEACAVSKMVSKFPFRDTTIRDLSLLDPSSRSKTTSASVTRLAKRFLRLSTEDMDDLHREFLDYKSMPEDQLPPVDASSPSAIDHFWSAIASMPAPGDAEQHRFTHLAELCKVLLVLPHSTASPERLFSMIRKIETGHASRKAPPSKSLQLAPCEAQHGPGVLPERGVVLSRSPESCPHSH